MLPNGRKARSPWSSRRQKMRESARWGSGSRPPSVDVLGEIPRGSRQKYELDAKSGRIRLHRVLFSSVHYPADYGFVMDTLRHDGDPVAALLVVEARARPGHGASRLGR